LVDTALYIEVSAGDVLTSPFQAQSFNITDLYHYDLSVTNVLIMVAEVTETSAKMWFTSIALTSKYFFTSPR